MLHISTLENLVIFICSDDGIMVVIYNFWWMEKRRNNHYPFKSSRCIKASFYIPENTLNLPTTSGFRTKISMTISLNFLPTSNHFHPLQVENCDSNSRLIVDEDDNGKFRLEMVKALKFCCINHVDWRFFLHQTISLGACTFTFINR